MARSGSTTPWPGHFSVRLAAEALALLGCEQGLIEERILPGRGEIGVAARVAAATSAKAQIQDVARKQVGPDRLYQDALAIIRATREANRLSVEAGIIPPGPERSGAQCSGAQCSGAE